jgi:hypothetical protein
MSRCAQDGIHLLMTMSRWNPSTHHLLILIMRSLAPGPPPAGQEVLYLGALLNGFAYLQRPDARVTRTYKYISCQNGTRRIRETPQMRRYAKRR